MPAEKPPLNYYTAVLQVLLSDRGRAFSISEIRCAIAAAHPLSPSRAAIVRALQQLHQVPLISVSTERRYLRCIPISVFQYKL